MKTNRFLILFAVLAVILVLSACGPAELGTEENPIIWAVVPSGETDRVVTGFEEVAAMLFEETGLVIEPFVRSPLF